MPITKALNFMLTEYSIILLHSNTDFSLDIVLCDFVISFTVIWLFFRNFLKENVIAVKQLDLRWYGKVLST